MAPQLEPLFDDNYQPTVTFERINDDASVGVTGKGEVTGTVASPAEAVEPLVGETGFLSKGPEPIPYRVVRSDKRRRTISARMIKGVMELRIPGRMSVKEEQHWIKEMLNRFARKQVSEQIDLMARCEALAKAHDLPIPETIRWVTNQESLWGSCTPANRAIRISDKLTKTPLWVLDYVIVHEMAHLRHGNHSAAFWKLVNRYPRTERARGYLEALGMTEADDDGTE